MSCGGARGRAILARSRARGEARATNCAARGPRWAARTAAGRGEEAQGAAPAAARRRPRKDTAFSPGRLDRDREFGRRVSAGDAQDRARHRREPRLVASPAASGEYAIVIARGPLEELNEHGVVLAAGGDVLGAESRRRARAQAGEPHRRWRLDEDDEVKAPEQRVTPRADRARQHPAARGLRHRRGQQGHALVARTPVTEGRRRWQPVEVVGVEVAQATASRTTRYVSTSTGLPVTGGRPRRSTPRSGRASPARSARRTACAGRDPRPRAACR